MPRCVGAMLAVWCRMQKPRVLLTGATGFVGSHIYPTLIARGFRVLCATRKPEEAAARDPKRDYVRFDLDDRSSVEQALAQVDSAVYLVHSMSEGHAYAKREHANAETFRRAAQSRGLERIVYLGGPRPRGRVSRHLESRLRTGETLREGSVPVVELQATMIIGGGSESFRIVRDLAARLPWMLLPKWLESKSEPVSIDDIGASIAHALSMPLSGSVVLGAPGPEVLSGRDIIMRTARALGQEPRVITVPLVTPRLSSYWIRLVTRTNPHVATELVEGLRSDIVTHGPTIWSRMEDHERVSFDEAVKRALREEAADLPASTKLVEKALHRITHAAPHEP